MTAVEGRVIFFGKHEGRDLRSGRTRRDTGIRSAHCGAVASLAVKCLGGAMFDCPHESMYTFMRAFIRIVFGANAVVHQPSHPVKL